MFCNYTIANRVFVAICRPAYTFTAENIVLMTAFVLLGLLIVAALQDLTTYITD